MTYHEKFGKGSAGQFTLGVSHVVRCQLTHVAGSEPGHSQRAQLGLSTRAATHHLASVLDSGSRLLTRRLASPGASVSRQPGVSCMIFPMLTLDVTQCHLAKQSQACLDSRGKNLDPSFFCASVKEFGATFLNHHTASDKNQTCC